MVTNMRVMLSSDARHSAGWPEKLQRLLQVSLTCAEDAKRRLLDTMIASRLDGSDKYVSDMATSRLSNYKLEAAGKISNNRDHSALTADMLLAGRNVLSISTSAEWICLSVNCQADL